MTNEKNFIGATTTIVGYVAVDPRYPAYDKEGSRGYKQVTVALNEGYKPKGGEFVKTGTTWYDIELHEDEVSKLGIEKGDKIRVDDAKQEVRTYKNKEGEEKLGITLKFGEITILESAQPAQGAADEEVPF